MMVTWLNIQKISTTHLDWSSQDFMVEQQEATNWHSHPIPENGWSIGTNESIVLVQACIGTGQQTTVHGNDINDHCYIIFIYQF